MNSSIGDKLVSDLGSRATFFEVDVTNTDSIAAAVKSTIEWTNETKAPLGGVLAGAGVGNPAKVRSHSRDLIILSKLKLSS